MFFGYFDQSVDSLGHLIHLRILLSDVLFEKCDTSFQRLLGFRIHGYMVGLSLLMKIFLKEHL